MAKICALVLLLVCLYSVNATHELGKRDGCRRTCSTHGVTHFRGFSTEEDDYVEPCYQYGPRVLLQNQWVKVTSHTYLNETSLNYDWMSSKIFIEFYADMPGIPIIMLTSDMLMCNCVSDCLANVGKMKMGVDMAIDLTIKKDNDSTVVYIHYSRANMTMYLRKGIKSFNFGVQAPDHMIDASSGMCVSSCPKMSDHERLKCFNHDNLGKLYDVCKLLFSDMKPEPSLENAQLSCSHDMFIWQDVLAGLDNRYTYIDELMIKDYSTINSKYMFGAIDKATLNNYQNVLKDIKCDDFPEVKPAQSQ